MSRLGKIIFGAVLLTLVVVSTPIIFIFVSAWFMFDGNCGEDSRPVALMRSLSQEQLAELNTRIAQIDAAIEISGKGIQNTELTSYGDPFIPDDLNYLSANYMSFRYSDPYIVLAKCNVSVGVTLYFEPSKNGKDTIRLEWENYNSEHPFRTSEVLWTGD